MQSKTIARYSKTPTHRGAIFQMEADERGVVFLEAKEKSLKLYLLVDPESERILEIKFFTYGGPIFTAVAEVLCKNMEDQTLDDACSLEPEMIERWLRDEPENEVLTMEAPELATIKPVLSLLKETYPEKKKLAEAAIEARKRLGEPTAFELKTEADKEWANYDTAEKITRIDKVIDEHIRAGLQMDGGDMEVLDVVDNICIKVKYLGACGSCGASSGGTLFFIEDTLRKYIHPQIRVEPVD